VAAGTLPRVEVTYVQPDDKDSASGCIQAVALIPDVDESGGGVKSLETVPVPFDTAAVDIREVLADGIRAAARRRLAGVLEGVAAAAAELGLAPTLENAAVNPAAAGATAAGARAGGAAAGAAGAVAAAAEEGTAAVEAAEAGAGQAGATAGVGEGTGVTVVSAGGSGFEGGGTDGWGASPRPAIVVRLTARGTAVEVTCGKRGGELSLCGAGSLVPSAPAAALEKTVTNGGVAALPKVFQTLRRAAMEHDLRAAVSAAGYHPHPASLRCDQGWPYGGAPPAVLLPVVGPARCCPPRHIFTFLSYMAFPDPILMLS
jgi:hypothetical protein